MPDRILVCVAWPYANGSIHIGQTAGAYIPADIFARYHRLKGNEVLMVSGSDSHGTPVTLEAEKRSSSPEEVFRQYHAEFLDCWERLGISFDLFTSTHTENHFQVAQDIFLRLHKNGYLYTKTMLQPYSEADGRFLADRYVEGVCPHCSFDGARGDQCDNCGRTLDPQELIDIRSRITGDTLIFKETEHFFFKLRAFESELLEWIRPQTHWRPNVKNFSIGYLEGGLQDRPITRDIEWGIPVPLEGYESKRIYVWFEAVIGYLSASKEWADRRGEPDRWKDFWQEDCKSYYFMGKDNIPFHTIIWPAMLLGYGGLNVPHDVPANEYMNLEGMKLSTSRSWAVWLPDYLKRYDPDPLRYVIAAGMPETSDSDFSWAEYVRRNNDELVATFGNLVHRVLTLSYRNFHGAVPTPSILDDESKALLDESARRLAEVGKNIEACRFRAALIDGSMSLAQAANRYLDHQAPWQTIYTDPATAATTLWTVMTVINCLKKALYPYLPFSCEKLHAMMGFGGSVAEEGWDWSPEDLKPEQRLQKPAPLFKKLDEDIAERETERIGRHH